MKKLLINLTGEAFSPRETEVTSSFDAKVCANPFPRLPNVKTFTVTVGRMDPLFAGCGIEKMFAPEIKAKRLSSRIRAGNRYLDVMVWKLGHLVAKHETKQFFILCIMLCQRSKVLRAVALRKLDKNWWKNFTLLKQKIILAQLDNFLTQAFTRFRIRRQYDAKTKPDGTKTWRPIGAPAYSARMLMFIWYGFFSIYFSGYISGFQHGYRKNKGVVTAWQDLSSKFFSNSFNYWYEFDLKQFFPSINRSKIVHILENLGVPKTLRNYFFDLSLNYPALETLDTEKLPEESALWMAELDAVGLLRGNPAPMNQFSVPKWLKTNEVSTDPNEDLSDPKWNKLAWSYDPMKMIGRVKIFDVTSAVDELFYLKDHGHWERILKWLKPHENSANLQSIIPCHDEKRAKELAFYYKDVPQVVKAEDIRAQAKQELARLKVTGLWEQLLAWLELHGVQAPKIPKDNGNEVFERIVRLYDKDHPDVPRHLAKTREELKKELTVNFKGNLAVWLDFLASLPPQFRPNGPNYFASVVKTQRQKVSEHTRFEQETVLSDFENMFLICGDAAHFLQSFSGARPDSAILRGLESSIGLFAREVRQNPLQDLEYLFHKCKTSVGMINHILNNTGIKCPADLSRDLNYVTKKHKILPPKSGSTYPSASFIQKDVRDMIIWTFTYSGLVLKAFQDEVASKGIFGVLEELTYWEIYGPFKNIDDWLGALYELYQIKHSLEESEKAAQPVFRLRADGERVHAHNEAPFNVTNDLNVQGLPQGGSLSPIFANVLIEYDLIRGYFSGMLAKIGAKSWSAVQYADDFIIMFSGGKNLGKYFEEEIKRPHPQLKAGGTNFSLEKSGWLMKNGKWVVEKFKFLGKTFYPQAMLIEGTPKKGKKQEFLWHQLVEKHQNREKALQGLIDFCGLTRKLNVSQFETRWSRGVMPYCLMPRDIMEGDSLSVSEEQFQILVALLCGEYKIFWPKLLFPSLFPAEGDDTIMFDLDRAARENPGDKKAYELLIKKIKPIQEDCHLSFHKGPKDAPTWETLKHFSLFKFENWKSKEEFDDEGVALGLFPDNIPEGSVEDCRLRQDLVKWATTHIFEYWLEDTKTLAKEYWYFSVPGNKSPSRKDPYGSSAGPNINQMNQSNLSEELNPLKYLNSRLSGVVTSMLFNEGELHWDPLKLKPGETWSENPGPGEVRAKMKSAYGSLEIPIKILQQPGLPFQSCLPAAMEEYLTVANASSIATFALLQSMRHGHNFIQTRKGLIKYVPSDVFPSRG